MKAFEEIAQEIILYEDTFLKSVYRHITEVYTSAVDLGILNSVVNGDMCNTILFQFVTTYSSNALRKMFSRMAQVCPVFCLITC